MIDIVNEFGNLIDVLVNERLPTGEYQMEWDASAYSSGIYFIRMQTKEFKDLKKCLFLK